MKDERPTRGRMMERIQQREPWDVVVVGGGATGLGAAVDAATRGYRTVLLEAHDFAKGTSSRSTKLIHGGVRYLAQGHVGLVREALRERTLLVKNAPHLVHDLTFVVPAYSWWDQPYYGLGLKLYDVLAGERGRGASRWVSRAEVLHRAPTLEPQRLRGGILYVDGQFDDARLAVTLLRTLIDQGGTAVNYAPVTSLLKDGGRVSGVIARDSETGTELTIPARAVINATGVFADALRELDEPGVAPVIAPSQGIHLVLDSAFLPGSTAVLVPKTDDGRVLFAIPWHNRVLIGTTDTPVTAVPLEPRPRPEEIDFLLYHAARYLTRDPRPEDIRSIYAGLRPLIRTSRTKSTARLSREYAVLVSTSGLVTITGGKWTTYRAMGSDAVNRAATVAGLPSRPSTTATLRLHGWTAQPEPFSQPEAVHGADVGALRRVLAERPGWDQAIHARLPYRLGEAAWSARFEMARTVEDVLARRTRALFLDAQASQEAAPQVASVLAAELGRNPAWENEQVRQFRELAEGYRLNRRAVS
jgi:glycerol-3-phosphate dehydrogenase